MRTPPTPATRPYSPLLPSCSPPSSAKRLRIGFSLRKYRAKACTGAQVMTDKVTLGTLSTGRSGAGYAAWRRLERVLVQPDRRRAGQRQDHAGAPDHVHAGRSVAQGAVLHRAGRAAAEDAALPAAVFRSSTSTRWASRSATSTWPSTCAQATSASVLERIMKEVEAFSPSLVFVDSFRSVAQTAKSRQRRRGRPAAFHPGARHPHDQLAGHHLPDRRVRARRSRKPIRS